MTNEPHIPNLPHRNTITTTAVRRRQLGRLIAAVAAVSLTAGLSACSDGDAEAGAITPAACDAVVALGSAMSKAPQDPSQFASFADDELVPIGATLVAELDGDAKASAETLHAAYKSVAATGDPAPMFEDADVSAASTEVGKLVHDECDVAAVDVEAIEYAFVGVPERVDAGRVSFAFENTGVEEHEMVLFRRNEGVTETLDELLDLPEDEQMAKMSFTGVTFGPPGTTNYNAMDLEPGTYFLICFIPQNGDGAPHFMGGMKETIEVS